MSRYKQYYSYIPYVIGGVLWWKSGNIDKKVVKSYSYNKGTILSQKFKNYTIWDEYVEPLIIKQFGVLFISGHSFIKGMVADNDNKNVINNIMNELEQEIKEEIDTTKE